MTTEEQRSPHARLRELLAIPERLRTDAQWDEIIEIEISQGPKKPSGNMSKTSGQAPSRQLERKPSPQGKHMRKRRSGGHEK